MYNQPNLTYFNPNQGTGAGTYVPNLNIPVQNPNPIMMIPVPSKQGIGISNMNPFYPASLPANPLQIYNPHQGYISPT